MKLQQCPEYSNIVAVSNNRLKQSLQRYKTHKKGIKTSLMWCCPIPGHDLWALNCCVSLHPPEWFYGFYGFLLPNSLQTGRKRPSILASTSWADVPPLQRRCCSSSVKTNQWLLLWVANECGRALITWASMNNTCAVGGACAARHCLTLDGDDMRGMRRRSVFHQESLLLQRLIGMNKKAFVSPFFRLH